MESLTTRRAAWARNKTRCGAGEGGAAQERLSPARAPELRRRWRHADRWRLNSGAWARTRPGRWRGLSRDGGRSSGQCRAGVLELGRAWRACSSHTPAAGARWSGLEAGVRAKTAAVSTRKFHRNSSGLELPSISSNFLRPAAADQASSKQKI